jgi:hypothetical protein
MANGTGSDIRASLSLSVSVSLFGFHFSSSALVLLQHRWSAAPRCLQCLLFKTLKTLENRVEKAKTPQNRAKEKPQ